MRAECSKVAFLGSLGFPFPARHDQDARQLLANGGESRKPNGENYRDPAQA